MPDRHDSPRREFLEALSLAALAAKTLNAAGEKSGEMIYRKLGRTGRLQPPIYATVTGAAWMRKIQKHHYGLVPPCLECSGMSEDQRTISPYGLDRLLARVIRCMPILGS